MAYLSSPPTPPSATPSPQSPRSPSPSPRPPSTSPLQLPPPPAPPPPPPTPQQEHPPPGRREWRARRAQYCVLLSAKLAASGDMSVRPEWPAWCALACGRVAAACVADAADIVILSTSLERLGRLCMPAPVAAVAPLDRGPCGAVVAALRTGGAVVCDAADEALVPMRRRQQLQLQQQQQLQRQDHYQQEEHLHMQRPPDPVVPPSTGMPGAHGSTPAVPAATLDAEHLSLSPSAPPTPPLVEKLPLAQLAPPIPPALPLFLAVAETCPPAAFAALRDGRVIVWTLVSRDSLFPNKEIIPRVVYRAKQGVSFTALDAAVQVTSPARDDDPPGNVAMVVIALDTGYADVLRITIEQDDRLALHSPSRNLLIERCPTSSHFDRIANIPQGNACRGSPVNVASAPPSQLVACDYGRILGLSWVDDGRVVFCGEDDGVYVVDVLKGGPRCPLGCHRSYVADVAAHGDSVVTAGWDGRLMLWPLSDARDLAGMNTSFAADDGVELTAVDPGRTFWGVKWPQEDVVFASSSEASGRCLLHRIELVTDIDESDEYDESYASGTSRPDQAMPA